MSTPTVPTKPDTPPVRPEKREAPAPEVLPAGQDDRAVDADLLLDIPQLSVEELSLDLDASLLLNHVKVDAKGLEAGIYLRADFGHLAALAGPGARGGRGGFRPRTADMTRMRSGLRELLGGPDAEQPRAAAEPPEREEREPQHGDARRNGHDAHEAGAGDRVRHAVAQGAKAAGLTAAGLAGGALLESRVKPSRKLHIPRRRTRARFLRDELAKRLP